MALDPALMAVTFTGVDGSAVDLKPILIINKELVRQQNSDKSLLQYYTCVHGYDGTKRPYPEGFG